MISIQLLLIVCDVVLNDTSLHTQQTQPQHFELTKEIISAIYYRSEASNK